MLAKRLAQTMDTPWPLVQYDLKRLVSIAMQDPEIAKMFPKWPTPDQFFDALKKSQK